ncbi:MAG: hypothetical protein LBS24_07320 [Clostridiales Family XIII bacterium]|jgi:hypothetical protein|nr:hypothetical protein [Clostridiales Family XIII bacterium]
MLTVARYEPKINCVKRNRFLELRYFCLQYPALKTERPAAAALIERAAALADGELSAFLIDHVTNGTSYDVLRNVSDMPAGKDRFYASRRKFFKILDRLRG